MTLDWTERTRSMGDGQGGAPRQLARVWYEFMATRVQKEPANAGSAVTPHCARRGPAFYNRPLGAFAIVERGEGKPLKPTRRSSCSDKKSSIASKFIQVEQTISDTCGAVRVTKIGMSG